MRFCILIILAICVMSVAPFAVPAQKIVKESIRSQEEDRVYYLFVPGKISPATPAPLIVMLHGPGRNGLSLVEKWREIAKKKGIVIGGPDALNSQGSNIPQDVPDFLHELVDALKDKYPINTRRIYLFGHSAGAGQALYLSLLESEYFAATAGHAGAMRAEDGNFLEQARRKIPIAIFVGTNDHLFPLPVVRATRDALNAAGFNTQLTEIKGHTHLYYDRAQDINRRAWEFLKVHELSGEPKFEQYQWGK